MKPKVAFFSFSCCEGCQLQVLSCEDELLELATNVDIVSFREAMTEKSDDYNIAFVEGAITTPHDIERIKKIRENADVLVALGACAHIGGVNMLKNFHPLDEVKKIVYGDKADSIESVPAMPLSGVVDVDLAIPGCPIDKKEFLRVVAAVLRGDKPSLPTYPVCYECKLQGNECLFNKGEICLGVITRAGSDAICPSFGNRCIGCRGLIDDPNVNACKEAIAEKGYSVNDIMKIFRFFYGNSEVSK